MNDEPLADLDDPATPAPVPVDERGRSGHPDFLHSLAPFVRVL
jgi:hypothetical protein